MNKLYLIDGHALIFKMYYAFFRHPMINSKGADMSILYGFTKYLLELMEREKPTHLGVAFDPPGGTFRNALYPEYKANRAATPQLVIDALDPLSEIIRTLNIPVLMVKGFEADDVIGTLAKRLGTEDTDVYMVTPDKDYGQLVDSHVFQYKPGKAGGEKEILGPEEISGKYGISSPSQVVEMLTICGDSSDNVPGVKGVGEVGAGKLIAKYGTVENIYAHLEELTPRMREMFEEARGYIRLSHELVTIKTDVPVEVSLEELAVNPAFSPAVADLFEKYEFASLKRYVSNIAVPKAPEQAVFKVEPLTPAEIVPLILKAGECSVRILPGTPGPTVAVGVFLEGKAYASCSAASEFKSILFDSFIVKYGHNLKLSINYLAEAGIPLKGKLMDIELMHYLINPERSHALEILAKSYLNADLGSYGGEAVTGSLFSDEGPSDDSKRLASDEAGAVVILGHRIVAEMEGAGVTDLYDKMEEPLISVLSKMERTGVRVDLDSLKTYAGNLRKEMDVREERIRKMAGAPSLNVSSPKQIGEILFDRLRLDPRAKKSSKGQYSTDETTLSELSDRHPIINEILEFRAVKKLLSTYIEPFPSYVSPIDGRIHTTFNQALTATGRLSSSSPNLQNIPIRTDRGREIRKAFVPGPPYTLIVSADYSQIELRIMAHLSCDQHLTGAFREGIDVHAATASKIFKVPLAEVTPDQRRIAKTANFGIMYGISAFGLSQRLGISRQEARGIIDDYFDNFPAISSYINDTVELARSEGYVETIFGRRRYLPDINSSNATIRALAERNAVNAPIQGTAADIIKMAMIGVDRRLSSEGLRSRMVLQVHDELVLETTEDELEAVKKLLVEEMEDVVKLSIPLTVDCNYGHNWLEAH
ncbi:MAG: DNA polymerase I [Bacteroidales bacterium]|nr:DNA polymerase I [Bacteroidales bacterium]